MRSKTNTKCINTLIQLKHTSCKRFVSRFLLNMFGASRGIAGSHLINLRRQRASIKSTHSLDVNSPEEYSIPNLVSSVREYVIPNFAHFEFRPIEHQQEGLEKVKPTQLQKVI